MSESEGMKPCPFCGIWTNLEPAGLCSRCLGDSRKLAQIVDEWGSRGKQLRIAIDQANLEAEVSGLRAALKKAEREIDNLRIKKEKIEDHDQKVKELFWQWVFERADLRTALKKAEEERACLHPHINYNAEADNYYCTVCFKGMGIAYYKEAKRAEAAERELEFQKIQTAKAIEGWQEAEYRVEELLGKCDAYAIDLSKAECRVEKLEGQIGKVNDALGILDHCQIVPLVDALKGNNAQLERRLEVKTEQITFLRSSLVSWRKKEWPGTDQDAVIDKDLKIIENKHALAEDGIIISEEAKKAIASFVRHCEYCLEGTGAHMWNDDECPLCGHKNKANQDTGKGGGDD